MLHKLKRYTSQGGYGLFAEALIYIEVQISKGFFFAPL